MSRERELLERTIEEWDSDRDLYEFHKVIEEIRDFLSTPEPEQDEEPVCWMKEDEDGDLEFNTLNQFSCGRSNGIPLYLHPAPRPELVRLSEEEIIGIVRADSDFDEMMWDDTSIRFARAIEDALEEKNTVNKSDPDSIDLQSRCRGDKP